MTSWGKGDLTFVDGANASVSKYANNVYQDVKSVIEMVNRIPPSQGGPVIPIPVPQPNDPLLSFAPETILGPLFALVAKYQQGQFGQVIDGGAIGPNSATALRLANLAAPKGDRIWAVKGTVRARALEIGDGEAGVVGDYGYPDNRSDRTGWIRLQAYFDESLTKALPWSQGPTAWAPLKYTDKLGRTHQLKSFREGVKIKGMRVPQSNKPEKNKKGEDVWRGISWCGIFANWCWNKAGLDTKWLLGTGPTMGGRKIPTSTRKSAICPGDIVVNDTAEVHHAIVVAVMPGAKEFLTIDGNSYDPGVDQTVTRHSMKAERVRYFYSVDSVLSAGRIAYN